MLRILLIESDASAAHHLQSLLHTCGHNIEVMPDGLVALAELERRQELPHLIFIRVEIPRMSGYSVCNKIKRRSSLRDVPLVLVSSQATPETFAQHRRLRTRANGYLSMPFENGELWQLMEELIPNSSAPADKSTVAELPSLAGAGLMDGSNGSWGDSHNSVGTQPEMEAVPESPISLHEPEPATAQLRAADMIDDDSIIELADEDLEELGEDDAFELSEDDMADSVDLRNEGSIVPVELEESHTIIHNNQVTPQLPTKVVVVQRGRGAEGGLRVQADPAQHLQELWGDAFSHDSEDEMATTIIAGQAPNLSKLLNEGVEESDTISGEKKVRHDSQSPEESAPVNGHSHAPVNGSHHSYESISSEVTLAPTSSTESKPPSNGMDSNPFLEPDPIASAPATEVPASSLEAQSAEEAASLEELQAELDRLRAENQRLRENGSFHGEDDPNGDSLSAFIAQQLDEIEEMNNDGSVVLLSNLDSMDDMQGAVALAEQNEKIAQLQQKLTDQEASIEQEREEWHERLARLEELAQPDNLLQMQVSEYRTRLDSVLEDNAELMEEVEQLRESIENMEHSADSGENAFDTQDGSPEFSEMLTTLKAEAEEKNNLISEYQERLEALEQEHKEQTTLVVELQEQLEERNVESVSHQETLTSWEERFHELENEHEQLQRVHQTKEVELEQLDDANKELFGRLEQRESDARELRAELAALRAQFSGQTSSDDELLLQAAEKEKELQLLRLDLNELGESYDGLETKYTALVTEHERVSQELKLRNNALLALDDERNQLADDILKLQQESASKDNQLEEMQQQLDVLEQDMEALHEEVDSVSQERNHHRDEMLQARNELDASREEQRNAREREGELRDEIDRLQQECHRLAKDLNLAETKLSTSKEGREGLEDEVVALRQNNMTLEQRQFELDEQVQRFQKERDELERQLQVEKESRTQQVDRRERVEARLEELATAQDEWYEKQKNWYTQKQEYQSITDQLRDSLQESNEQRESLELSNQTLQEELDDLRRVFEQQLSSYQTKLNDLEQRHERLMSEHQQELVEMQIDWEDDTQNQLQTLRLELDAHWQNVLEEERSRLSKHEQDMLASQETLWQQKREELQAVHQMELQRVRQELGDEISETRLVHRTEIEQIQDELQRQHSSMLEQLEEDNKRLRQQVRNAEQEQRQAGLQREEEWRLETDQRIAEAEKKTSLRLQAVIEGLEQRERELEHKLTRVHLEYTEKRQGHEDLEIELETLRGQVADLETLRRHERHEIQRLKKERAQQEQLLQERIDELEQALLDRRNQASELYQRLKQQESQRANTAQALRDALSLLGGQNQGGSDSTSPGQADREEKVLAEIAKLAKLDF